jgi:VanZ family protein
MFKRNKLIPTILWGFFVLYLTLRPKSESGGHLPVWLENLHPDKIAHFVFWGIWAVIFQFTYLKKKIQASIQFSQKDLQKSQLKFAICAIIVGGAIELIQLHLNWGRSAEWLDFLADTLGIVLGLLVGSFNPKETQLR